MPRSPRASWARGPGPAPPVTAASPLHQVTGDQAPDRSGGAGDRDGGASDGYSVHATSLTTAEADPGHARGRSFLAVDHDDRLVYIYMLLNGRALVVRLLRGARALTRAAVERTAGVEMDYGDEIDNGHGIEP